MTRCAGLRQVIACALVVLAAAVCRPVRAAETVSFGITSTVAFSLAHYIAAEKQFYAAENLALTPSWWARRRACCISLPPAR